jgi:hypothetical protein
MGRILIPKLTGIPVATTNQFTVSNSSISQVGGNYTKVTANSYQVFGSSKYLFWGYSEPNRWTLINFTNGFFATNPTMSDGTKIPTSDWPNGETISALSSKISIKKQNLGGGKINLNKKYLYKVTGTGLTPNINGLRFYDSGLIYNGKKSFYSEDGQYAIWYVTSPVGIWLIGSIANIGTYTSNAWGKVGATDTVAGSYIAAGDRVGAVTVSAI